MEENKLVKYGAGLVEKVGNSISITNKLLTLSAEALFNQGVEKANMGRYEEAIIDFTSAMRIENENGIRTKILHEACFERSKAKAKIEDIEGSKRDVIVASLYKKAWRIRNEGFNEREKKIFGLE